MARNLQPTITMVPAHQDDQKQPPLHTMLELQQPLALLLWTGIKMKVGTALNFLLYY